jgi:hypothetical protein
MSSSATDPSRPARTPITRIPSGPDRTGSSDVPRAGAARTRVLYPRLHPATLHAICLQETAVGSRSPSACEPLAGRQVITRRGRSGRPSCSTRGSSARRGRPGPCRVQRLPPIGLIGTATDMAAVITCLLSERASWVAGAVWMALALLPWPTSARRSRPARGPEMTASPSTPAGREGSRSRALVSCYYLRWAGTRYQPEGLQV